MDSLYLLCADNTLYTGVTTNLTRRFKQHASGKGAKYTRARGVVRYVYTKKYPSRSEALKEEYRIKHLNRENKIRLIGEILYE